MLDLCRLSDRSDLRTDSSKSQSYNLVRRLPEDLLKEEVSVGSYFLFLQSQLVLTDSSTAAVVPNIMVTINTLPNELLTQIFTFGCDEDDATSGYHYQYENRHRHPKSFTQTVMPVCQLWRDLATAKGNSHLWLASISFGKQEFYDIPKVVNEVEEIRTIVTASDGCDLALEIAVYTLFDEYDPEDDDAKLSLLIRLLELLDGYRSQWMCLYLDLTHPVTRSEYDDTFANFQFPRLRQLYLTLDDKTEISRITSRVFSTFYSSRAHQNLMS